MDNTIIQQGSFTSTGVSNTIVLRSDVDWMRTVNLTTSAGATQWDSTEHYWQRNMAAGQSIIHYHGAATQADFTTTSIAGFNGVANRPAFYPIDSSASLLGAPTAVTAGTNVTAPVYTTGATLGLVAGNIVRIYGTAQTDINGLDFTVGAVTTNTNFALANTLATAPGVVAGANGFWRFVAPDVTTYNLFYPGKRVIANISQAASAVVTTLVDHGYQVGMTVRMNVPAVCSMTQMNGLLATITAVAQGSFTINIDSTNFTAFTFPTYLFTPFTPAEVIPVGDTAGGTLAGATLNQGYIGMVLGSLGAVSGTPTGVNGDLIFWVAGKSFNL
jgi:hypothetical protein